MILQIPTNPSGAKVPQAPEFCVLKGSESTAGCIDLAQPHLLSANTCKLSPSNISRNCSDVSFIVQC